MATTILKSQNIFVGNGKIINGFVVIEGNRIFDVKPIEALDNYKYSAQIVDYGDQTVMPAFHDGHLHLLIAAIGEKGGFLRDAKSEEEAALQFYNLNKNNKSKWLLGGAWDPFKWPNAQMPDKKTLDKYFPDQMVFLLNREIHGAWVNTKTLEYFNINKNTTDPEFGKYFRYDNGEPTGYIHENASYLLLQRVLAEMSNAEISEYVQALTKTAHANGVTAVSDVQVGDVLKYEAYDEMDQKDQLNLRIHYSPTLTLDNSILLRLKEKHVSEKLRFSGTKGFVDGTASGHTALMIEPYLDEPDNTGCASIDLDYLKERICELDAMGIRVRLHACGDLSVRIALDDFENAKRINGNKGNRHTIEHIELASPEDLGRFEELDVVGSVQPDHLPRYDFYNHPFHTFVGAERMKYSWPFGSILRSGGRLCFGTDYPTVGINPMQGLFRAMNRVTDQFEPKGGFNPNEKLDLHSALDAYTAGSAYVNYRENDLGVLKIGYLADIVVLDRNIFDVLPENLRSVKVAATYFDGRKVFEK